MIPPRRSRAGTSGGGGESEESELSHQRPSRSPTRRSGRNSKTRQLHSGREAVSFQAGLEQYHHRSVGARDCFKRLRLTFYGSSSISTRATRDASAYPSSKTRSALDGSPVPLGQGSHRGDSSRHAGGGGGYYSHYFLATKKTGGFRPILNLRGLNAYLLMEKFRMETLASILRDLQQGMWMISLDLKDAYQHVPIIPLHRKFLRFALRDQQGILRVYQWAVLPFGLATAPRVFTKILAPIAAHLHLRSMSRYPYIDDIFHAQISRDSVILTRDASVRLHLQLGFVINLAKSSLIPSQVMTHLGAWIDTLNGRVRPSQNKVQEINQVSADLLANSFVSAGRLQSAVGLLAACYATVPLCLFRLRPLSSHLSRNFKWRTDPIQKIIHLDVPEVLEAPQFWLNPS